MANGDTKTNQYLDIAANGTRADLPSDTCCETRTQSLIRGVAERVMDVEEEVERLENNPDVVDIVATYADLQSYDTSGLTDKDIIRVLEDSTHNNNSTYYRWNATTNQFDFVGEISGGSVNVVQTTGTSTTDVMSQDATSSMVYADPDTKTKIIIGNGAGNPANQNPVAIGNNAISGGNNGIAIGSGTVGARCGVAIGDNANANYLRGSIALGSYSHSSSQGEMNVGTSDASYGYDNTNYRLITGVHDPVNDHDAATKAYVDANAGGSSYKTLTEADYNWNSVNKTTTGTLDSIAPWLLDDGIYYVDNTVYVAQTNSIGKSTNSIYANKSFIVFKDPDLNGISTGILLYSPSDSYSQPLFIPYINNGSMQIGSIAQGVLLNQSTIANNLTTTNPYRVLDARQGKALKDLIDALDARVSALEGN